MVYWWVKEGLISIILGQNSSVLSPVKVLIHCGQGKKCGLSPESQSEYRVLACLKSQQVIKLMTIIFTNVHTLHVQL